MAYGYLSLMRITEGARGNLGRVHVYIPLQKFVIFYKGLIYLRSAGYHHIADHCNMQFFSGLTRYDLGVGVAAVYRGVGF